MKAILTLDQIKPLLAQADLLAAMEAAFVQYSNGNCVVPPVGELLFDRAKGETHIKYGYIKGDDYYVIKIASGFYDNPKLGLSSCQGMMLLFNQKTGQPVSILLDDGHLTDLRTAAAGALVAKYFAPKNIQAIGIIGTGIQARLQVDFLKKITPCRAVWVWGRTPEQVRRFVEDSQKEWNIQIAASPRALAQKCKLIVTTTPSTLPLLRAADIQAGTHITAVGSDTATKQELESDLLAKADIVLVDSLPQSKSRGEVFQAVSKQSIAAEQVIELGKAIQDPTLQRTSDQQITIADLTGVAVQDIMIAKAVYQAYQNSQRKTKG
ncbi:MAG: ornithine cyclodeaminase family protein [Bacteroidota bacterium]